MYRIKIDNIVVPVLYSENPIKDGERIKGAIVENIDLTFTIATRVDFLYITDMDYNHVFDFLLEYSSDFGATFSESHRGSFTKKDCEIDFNKGFVKVAPLFRTDYDDFKDNRDRQFTISELGVPPVSVKYTESPTLQMYYYRNTVMNIGVGHYSEDISNTNISSFFTLQENYFTWDTIGQIQGIIDIPDIGGIGGEYRFSQILGNGNTEYIDATSTKTIEFLFQQPPNSTPVVVCDLFVNGNLIATGDYNGDVLVKGQLSEFTIIATSEVVPILHFNPSFRMLTNAEVINTNATTVNDSQVLEISRYEKVYNQFLLYDLIEISKNLSINDQGYGIVPEGEPSAGQYYEPPNNTDQWLPIFGSDWGNYSFWLKDGAGLSNILSSGSKARSTKAGYSIGLLLNAIVPRINSNYNYFLNTSSVFLDTTPMPLAQLSTPLQFPYLIPQSNIISNVGVTPNQKLKISLGEIEDILFTIYQLVFYLADGLYKLEHLEYFNRGLSYDLNNIGVDTTTLINARNGTNYSYATNNYKHDDKDSYKSLLMDSESEIGSFQSAEIECVDNYVSEKNESKTIPMLVNLTEQLIKNEAVDKWFFAACVLDGFTPTIPLVEIIHNSKTYRAYNGYCMPIWVLLCWYMDNSPCVNVKVNGVAKVTNSQQLIRENEIVIPYSDHNYYELITTLEGDGFVKSYESNEIENNIKITLGYGI